MCTVSVNIDSLYLIAVDISAAMIPFLYHKAAASCLSCLTGKNSIEKSCTHQKIVIVLLTHILFPHEFP